MARRSVSIYVNNCCEENHVRTFGGNGSDARDIVNLYNSMTKEEFLIKHPKFADMCREKFKLHIIYG